jgi:beta-galactosidase
MKIKSLFLLLTVFLFIISCTVQNQKFERETNFNANWKFIRADVAKAEQPAFDDASWRTLDLPHDFSIEDLPPEDSVKQIGPFSGKSAGGISTGHVVGGTAWYRKHFTLDNADEGKIVKILFDGIYMNADVWLNGHHLGNHPYGYTAFAYDLTEHLNPAGQDNVLAVQVKNEGKNSRWYSGSGIYRSVTLIKTNTVHFDLWGNYISTAEVSAEKAMINFETQVENTTQEAKDLNVIIEIKNPAGKLVTQIETKLQSEAGKKNALNQKIEVANPQLWSPEKPELYIATVTILDGKKVIDKTDEIFGIRTIEFSADKGFLLNGENTLLKGGCLHHDNGPLGSAAFETAEFRRVKTMKENGFNAIRTSHNPPSKTFLDACDKLGMLVMDESFDQWQKPKNPQDYNLYFDQWWEKDMESMVKRDRNHPSIIIWSVGNEIKERGDSSGLEIARKLKEKILEFDKTRPVTQAVCEFWDNPGKTWNDTEKTFVQMDVCSYNYQWKQYEPDHSKFPERIMIGTESIAKEAFENWQMVEKYPYVIGDFVWTGMDYFGESGIGSTKLDDDTTSYLPPWPWFNANCGDISVLGYKKPQMYFRDVVWRNSDLEMLVHSPIPAGRKEIVSFWGWPNEWKSWNWEAIGTKKVSEDTKLKAQFEVPYQPGELVAIGLKEGKEVTRQGLKTAGIPAQLKITAEENSFPGVKNELAYFNIEVLDENGLLIPNTEIPVEFEISGNGKLQAAASENPKEMQSFQQPRVNTYRGKCQVIVRLGKDGGQIVVTAKSEGLKPATN